jgi:hypothetical protein
MASCRCPQFLSAESVFPSANACNLCAEMCIFHRQIPTIFTNSVYIPVRYHYGGWSKEVNSCILIISYMVYLKPKHSLGYYLYRQQHLYTHIQVTIYIWRGPLAEPLLNTFYLLGNPPSCDRIRPPRSQVTRKLTSPFSALSHSLPTPNSQYPG